MNQLVFTFIVVLGCTTVSTKEEPKINLNNITVNENQSENQSFTKFLESFPDLKLPYNCSDKKTNTFSAKAGPALSPEEVSQFLCNKILVCFQKAGESDASDDSGFDIRNRFYPVGKVIEKNYVILIYHLSNQGIHEKFLSTHDKSGKLISRISFSGTNGSYTSLDGELTLEKEINLIFKNLSGAKKATGIKVKSEKNKKYKISSSGQIQDFSTQKLVADNLRKYN